MNVCQGSKRGSYRGGGGDVLGKQDTLGLDDDEVDELVDITKNGVKSLAGDGVVAAGTELAGKASVHDRLASDLSGDGDAEDHPREPEAPSQHIQVPNREDGGDDGEVGDRGSACVARLVSLVCPQSLIA